MVAVEEETSPHMVDLVEAILHLEAVVVVLDLVDGLVVEEEAVVPLVSFVVMVFYLLSSVAAVEVVVVLTTREHHLEVVLVLELGEVHTLQQSVLHLVAVVETKVMMVAEAVVLGVELHRQEVAAVQEEIIQVQVEEGTVVVQDIVQTISTLFLQEDQMVEADMQTLIGNIL